MACGRDEAEATSIYSGAPRYVQRSGAEFFATRHGIELLETFPSFGCLGSSAGKTETSPSFKRCSSTHTAGSDITVNLANVCRCTLKCFSAYKAGTMKSTKLFGMIAGFWECSKTEDG